MRGNAFGLAVAGVCGSATGLCTFLSLLALEVLPNIRGPFLGDTWATVSVLGCMGGAALFVGSWVMAASAWRSIVFYRHGVLSRGQVERVSARSDEDSSRLTLHWHLRIDSGHVHSLRSTLALPRGGRMPSRPAPGETMLVLHHEHRPLSAQPAGLLGLRREWHLVPDIQPPTGFNAFRIVVILIASFLIGLAITGLTVNRTLDPDFLKPWTWLVVVVAALLTLPAWLGLRRFGAWIRGQGWVWIMACFLAGCLGAMGAMSGANVWFDSAPPRFIRSRVMHMDDEYFPGWHRAAYVRSWREGHLKERIPLHWRMGLSIFPGDSLLVEVHEGALGWPFIAEVKRH